ncbi:hypothetical protein ZOSMA_178G00430 [Zostera marina]|uniref:C3H1-type domain-containing protein n=1 Tax=Zostera marina TaxID=29655 RepID=A0A0K9PRT7_ZOSMR|nr:hypothetical protein ZOSMA_178G00430 [Zostera marina]
MLFFNLCNLPFHSFSLYVSAFLLHFFQYLHIALYHQSALGSHNSIGQGDAMFSTNSLVNRPRIQTASHLSIYPQRPLEKDCAHYMLTRTCKFGDTCKFNHPIWVPVGGMPNWNEVMVC